MVKVGFTFCTCVGSTEGERSLRGYEPKKEDSEQQAKDANLVGEPILSPLALRGVCEL